MSRRLTPRTALTLMELVMVMVLLGALAAIMVPVFSGLVDDSRDDTTRSTLRELQTLISNRYLLDMRGKLASTSALVLEGVPGPDPTSTGLGSRTQHPQLHFLFVNPTTYDTQSSYDYVSARGWRGPYLLRGASGTYALHSTSGFDATYGEPGDSTVLDGWGNPVVIQGTTLADALLVSAGPDGSLLTTNDNLTIPLR